MQGRMVMLMMGKLTTLVMGLRGGYTTERLTLYVTFSRPLMDRDTNWMMPEEESWDVSPPKATLVEDPAREGGKEEGE